MIVAEKYARKEKLTQRLEKSGLLKKCLTLANWGEVKEEGIRRDCFYKNGPLELEYYEIYKQNHVDQLIKVTNSQRIVFEAKDWEEGDNLVLEGAEWVALRYHPGEWENEIEKLTTELTEEESTDFYARFD